MFAWIDLVWLAGGVALGYFFKAKISGAVSTVNADVAAAKTTVTADVNKVTATVTNDVNLVKNAATTVEKAV